MGSDTCNAHVLQLTDSTAHVCLNSAWFAIWPLWDKIPIMPHDRKLQCSPMTMQVHGTQASPDAMWCRCRRCTQTALLQMLPDGNTCSILKCSDLTDRAVTE
jgi:hypothetical protein